MAYADRLDAQTSVGARSRRALGAVLGHPEALVAAALTVGFIAMSAWWVSVDTRVPNGDNGKHIVIALGYVDALEVGHWLSPILAWTQYPPLVHVVGAIGAAIGGESVASVVIAENVVFVPLLALGCYQAASIVFGRLAGLLSVVFVLAAPMVMSLFHVFMLDAPAAALAAVSVWLLLASKRFASLPWTFAAAVAISAGMYVKATFVFFVAGLAVALLIRDRGRHWKNFVLGFGLFLVLVEPWYFAHLQDLRGMATGAIRAQTTLWYESVPYPDRWSVGNFTWYWWNLVNNQLYLPLTIFFVVGLVTSVVVWWRRRPADSYVPELVVGGLVSYVGISLISLDDPRYSLPMLVYVAIFATGWIVYLPARAQLAAVAAFVLVLVVNTTMQSVVEGDQVIRVSLPGATESPIRQRKLTVVSNAGYIEGPPLRNGVAPRLVDLLERARADGAEKVVFQPESMNNGGYNLFGLSIFARIAGLEVPGFDWTALGPEDIYVFRMHPTQAGQAPCLESWDRTGIYMNKGQPSADNPIYCPPPAG